MDKNSKNVTSLFIILALLALAALAVSVNRQSSETEQQALIPELQDKINSVTALRIYSAGDLLVADVRQSDAGWRVHNADNYPADLGTLRQVLLALAEAEVIENTTSQPENFVRLGVEDVSTPGATGLRIELDGLDGQVNLILGNASSGDTSFARQADNPQSWRISKAPDLGKTTLEWLDRTIADIPASDIVSMTISHSDGESVVIAKTENGYELTNNPADKALRYPDILNSVVSALEQLQFDVVIARDELEKGDAKPIATITANTIDGLSAGIVVTSMDDATWINLTYSSAEPGDPTATAAPDALAAESESLNAKVADWAYQIPSFKADWLLKRQTDLLEAPAE